MWTTLRVVQLPDRGPGRSYPQPSCRRRRGGPARPLAPQGLTGEFDALGVMNQAIEDSVGEGRIADCGMPFVDRQLAGEAIMHLTY
jgi:hypothetical protein